MTDTEPGEPGWELIAQGAEAVRPSIASLVGCQLNTLFRLQRVYRADFLSQQAIVKERFKKLYRHPALDEKLTKERMTLVGASAIPAVV